MLDWFKGGSEWLNKGAKFTVTDGLTGKSFRATRFGGWYHADSEPITKYDTSIIKSLEGFSWNKKAIWVTYKGKTVAASMHTMPHMANPTESNGFDGHFAYIFSIQRCMRTARSVQGIKGACRKLIERAKII